MDFCASTGNILNTGIPESGQRPVSSAIKLIAVRSKADDGTFNQILSTDVLDDVYLEGKVNEVDPSKRWYPIGKFENPTDARADPVVESFNTGESAITQKGIRTYIGWLINYAPVYVKTLNSFSGVNFGLYIVDNCGSLTGEITKDGTALKPIRVNRNSWEPRYMAATPTISAKVQLMFQFSQLVNDADMRVISSSEITGDVSELDGLIPVKGESSNISSTGFKVALTVDFDGFNSSEEGKIKAWDLDDFILRNKDTNSSVTITSVMEAPSGEYTFVISSSPSGNNLELTNVRTSERKPGFSLSEIITIP